MGLFTIEQIIGAIGAWFMWFIFAPLAGLWEYTIGRWF